LISQPPLPPPLPPTVQPVIIEPRVFPDLPESATSCTIDLIHNRHNCQHLRAISFVQQPRFGETVTQLTLDPFTTGYVGARFDITYGDTAEGWSVNIGDSATNDGYAGDSGTQSNDAELQILDGQLTIYGSDYTNPERTLDGHRQLYVQDNFAGAAETVTIEVQNQQLWWMNQWAEVGSLESSALYALARQPDEEGSSNYDLFAAFNRAITHNGRSGNGVEMVTITLIPAK
ncbi:MAG: hypothetical protein KDE51_15045, partial [Anaerolineales bacterium]|nr:hypothetical protein [Anaerolineales bacterium]